MKKLWIILLVTLMSSTMASPVMAAKQAKASNVVTHQELGNILVKLLGLSRALPANPSSQEVFSSLLLNGISPNGGWRTDQKVTRADLARVVVQALGLADEVKNPSDPNAWIEVAKAQGISIDTVGQATDKVIPLLNPIDKDTAFGATTDPLARAVDTSAQQPDASSFGTDMALPVSGIALEEVLAVLSEIVTPPRRRVVTPN